jgi:hypothetical protein
MTCAADLFHLRSKISSERCPRGRDAGAQATRQHSTLSCDCAAVTFRHNRREQCHRDVTRAEVPPG